LIVRGDSFHNELTGQVRALLEHLGWRVWTEKKVKAAGTTAYFDVLAVKAEHRIAFEIETTARHAVDNARKAHAVGVSVWFVAPNRGTKRQIVRQLDKCLAAGGERAAVLLLGEIESELARQGMGQTVRNEPS
jgi:hypothetical protein